MPTAVGNPNSCSTVPYTETVLDGAAVMNEPHVPDVVRNANLAGTRQVIIWALEKVLCGFVRKLHRLVRHQIFNWLGHVVLPL